MKNPKKFWMNCYAKESPATPNDESAFKRPVQQNPQHGLSTEEMNIKNSKVRALITFLTDDYPVPGSHLTSAQSINENMAIDSIKSPFMSCEFPGSNAVARNNLRFNQPSSMSMNMQQNQVVPSCYSQVKAHLTGQNPMLTQTSSTAPSIPTSVSNNKVSQLSEEQVPKNLEKNLVHTSGIGATASTSSATNSPYSFSVQGGVWNILPTSLQQEVTADSRGQVTLAPQNSANFPQSTNFLGKALSAGETCSNLNHQNYGNSFSSNSKSQQSVQAANIFDGASSNTNCGNAGGADPLDDSAIFEQILDMEEDEKEREKKRSSRKRRKLMNARQPIPDNMPNFVSPVSCLFPDGMNNIVAPTVSLQRTTGMPEQSFSCRYSTIQFPVASAPQQSPFQLPLHQCQQPPFSPISQQGYLNSGQSSHLYSQPGTNPAWLQKRASQNTANLQEQNPVLNPQFSQPQAAAASFGREVRFANQQPQFHQSMFRSMPSPGSRNSPYSNPADFPFHPPSPTIAEYQQQVQTLPQQPIPVPQQRLQRTVSILNGQPTSPAIFSQSLSVAGANDNQLRTSCPRMNFQACMNAWQPVPDIVTNFQTPGSASFPVRSNTFMYNTVAPNLTLRAPRRRTRRSKKQFKRGG